MTEIEKTGVLRRKENNEHLWPSCRLTSPTLLVPFLLHTPIPPPLIYHSIHVLSRVSASFSCPNLSLPLPLILASILILSLFLFLSHSFCIFLFQLFCLFMSLSVFRAIFSLVNMIIIPNLLNNSPECPQWWNLRVQALSLQMNLREGTKSERMVAIRFGKRKSALLYLLRKSKFAIETMLLHSITFITLQ